MPMQKILSLIDRLLHFLLITTVLLLIIPVSLQIFSRFTELIPRYMWTEEMSRLFFFLVIMRGAPLGVRLHFDVDFLPELSPRATHVLLRLSQTAMLVFSVVILYWGIEFTKFGWNQTSELAEMPMWWIFIAWPIAGFLWIVFILDHILNSSDISESSNQGSVI
jgi:TRAP-type C4-dicarboxylate transport system permease small subunit